MQSDSFSQDKDMTWFYESSLHLESGNLDIQTRFTLCSDFKPKQGRGKFNPPSMDDFKKNVFNTILFHLPEIQTRQDSCFIEKHEF